MDLSEFKSGTPATKPWLDIVCSGVNSLTVSADSVTANSVTASAFSSDSLVVLNQAGVANPAPGKLAIYSDLSGDLKTNDALGNTSSILSQAGGGTVDHIPIYTGAGAEVVDSGFRLADYAPLDGAAFTGTISAPSVFSSGLPVCSWNAAKGASWASVGPGTAAETSMIGLPYNGTLVIPQPVTRGYSLRMSWLALFASAITTTTTFRFKVNGTTVLSTVIPPAAVVNNSVRLDYWMQIQEGGANRICIGSNVQQNGVAPIINSAVVDGVWNPAAANTLSATVQFSDVNGTWFVTQWDTWSSYPQLF